MRATCEHSIYHTVVKESRDGIRWHFVHNGAPSSEASNKALSIRAAGA